MNYSDLDILYLTTKDVPDYLQDALYMGFCELGCNVVDFPIKGSLHGRPHNSIYNIPHLLFNYPERTLRKEPDLIIVTAMLQNYGSYINQQTWMDFVQNIVKTHPSAKVIILDSNDQKGTSYPILSGREYDAVFKRELTYLPYENWYSINFSSIPETFYFIPYGQRKYDVSFVATISNFYREEVRDFINKKAEELNLSIFTYVERQPLDRQKYLDVLSQSKTAVSVTGAGKDCYRYWEIPAKGVVMIAEDPGLYIHSNFNKDHIFKFKYLSDLGNILKTVKEIPDEKLEEMALNSLWFTHAWHTPRKRAEYILRKVL